MITERLNRLIIAKNYVIPIYDVPLKCELNVSILFRCIHFHGPINVTNVRFA